MSNLLRHRFGLLTAALFWAVGSVGLSQSPSPHGFTYASTPHPSHARFPAPVDSQALEFQVELAWWSDPVTFPYYLDAKFSSNQLELRGYVPSEYVRRRAIELAQQYAGASVRDSLQTYGRSIAATPLTRPVEFRRNVSDVLQKLFPRTQHGMHVYCGLDGKIIVSGTANSWLAKWTVSDALRKIPDCTCIDNRMAVVVHQASAVQYTTRPKQITSFEQPVMPNSFQPTAIATPLPIRPDIAPTNPSEVETIDMRITTPIQSPAKVQPVKETKSEKSVSNDLPKETITLPAPPVLKLIGVPTEPVATITTADGKHADQPSGTRQVAPEAMEQMAKSMVVAVKSMDAVASMVKQWTVRGNSFRRMPMAAPLDPPSGLVKSTPFALSKKAMPNAGAAYKPATIYPTTAKVNPIHDSTPSACAKCKPKTKYPAKAKPAHRSELPAIGIADPIFLPEIPQLKQVSTQAITEPKESTTTRPTDQKIKNEKVQALPYSHKRSASPMTKRRPPNQARRIYQSAAGTYNPLYVSPNVKVASHQSIAKPISKMQQTAPTYREVYLTKQIQAAANVTNVELRFLAPKKLQLRYAVKTRAEGVRTAERIRRMSELRQYHLHFQLQLLP